MQNQNWRLNQVVVLAAVTLLIVSFSTLAMGQRAVQSEERNAIFASAPKVATSVKGVSVFAAPPKGFDFRTATNIELLTYGLPQRPDKAANAKGYDHWERAMLALKTRVTDVKAKPYTSREMMGGKQTAGVVPDASGVTFYNSGNWSGIANTNNNKVWKNTTSFDEVVSVWNVPVANHPFGNLPCSEGPWFEVTWNGIDGFNNGDVVQGGSTSYWDGGGCGGPIEYYGWVEWYPSYSILALSCGSGLCPVGPGDDFEVITFGAPGTSNQNVFVEDVTQQWGGTVTLGWLSGPGLVGSSAEYIVERPCCNGSVYYPLGNYVWEFFNDSYAYDVAGALFYPGSTSAKTAIITMLADDGSAISYPVFYGTAGNQGRYSFWLSDEGCANAGGCVP
jgi:hypothetical protein